MYLVLLIRILQLEKKNMTPSMQQYWGIKSKNFNKIIFFKVPKVCILY